MKMKKTGILLAAILAVFTLAGCATVPAGDPTITIVNNTGYPVHTVNVSASTDTYWGQNLLEPGEIMYSGQSISLDLLTPLSQINQYDIRLIDTDEDAYTQMRVRVRNGSRIVFTFNHFRGNRRNTES